MLTEQPLDELPLISAAAVDGDGGLWSVWAECQHELCGQIHWRQRHQPRTLGLSGFSLRS